MVVQVQSRSKIPTKQRLISLSEEYLSVLRQQKEPFMDLTTFLEKWMPHFFPGIVLYDKRRIDLHFTVTDETVSATYDEACVKLLSCWFPYVNFLAFRKWGSWEDIKSKCPESYKVGLFNINMALEMALIGQSILAKEQSQLDRQAEDAVSQKVA